MKRWLFGVFTSLIWALMSGPAFAAPIQIYVESSDAGSDFASAQNLPNGTWSGISGTLGDHWSGRRQQGCIQV